MTIRSVADHSRPGVSPVAYPTPQLAVYDDAATPALFDATALPASGAWRRSEIFDCGQCRTIKLRGKYLAHASTTTGAPRIRAWATGPTATGTPPGYSTSGVLWVPASVTDGSIVATAQTGAVPSGDAYTAGPLWALQAFAPLFIAPPAAVAHSDIIPGAVTFDVSADCYFFVEAQEFTDQTNRGTLTIAINGV